MAIPELWVYAEADSAMRSLELMLQESYQAWALQMRLTEEAEAGD